ncbi:hypothetical protein [Actinoplanes sp. NPDC051851]|uniref:hypothetical protein n=1 Tax=Actinoplanes sp. NPDC051851 TaxID=3154753 RepID=UPI0034310BFF
MTVSAPHDSPRWPEEETPLARPDWRERLALAADLALIGFAVTFFALPVLTAPAALATGSTAVHHRYRNGRFPDWGPLLRQYRRAILPGLPVLLAAALLAIDLTAVRGGWVPGGPLLLTITTLATLWLSGLATLTLVTLGRDPALPWRAAARWSWDRPRATAALAATTLFALFLALAVPVTTPLVIGFHLFAAHVLADRLAPAPLTL